MPFENMIYIADGPSEVPVFPVLNQSNGKACAVYDAGSEPQSARSSAVSSSAEFKVLVRGLLGGFAHDSWRGHHRVNVTCVTPLGEDVASIA